MTIYIVYFRNFHDENEFCGAFSTEAKAQDYVSRFMEPASSFQIDEYEVDSE